MRWRVLMLVSLGVNVGLLIGSTVIVEYVFGIPGLGLLMINAITSRDYPTFAAMGDIAPPMAHMRLPIGAWIWSITAVA